MSYKNRVEAIYKNLEKIQKNLIPIQKLEWEKTKEAFDALRAENTQLKLRVSALEAELDEIIDHSVSAYSSKVLKQKTGPKRATPNPQALQRARDNLKSVEKCGRRTFDSFWMQRQIGLLTAGLGFTYKKLGFELGGYSKTTVSSWARGKSIPRNPNLVVHAMRRLVNIPVSTYDLMTLKSLTELNKAL